MTLTEPQFAELIEKYSEFIVDSMDMDTLVQFAYDSLVAEFTKYNEKELIAEIVELYDNEVAADLIESVGADPDTIL
jgi:predicted Zn-dependent protease with MMP-like domain